jgi:imidazolonepropionase-like amidohydrolase
VTVSIRSRRAVCSVLPSVFLLVLSSGCKPPETANAKAIVGAVLIDGVGGPPVSNSVILISGPRIAATGPRTAFVIPQGADQIDGSRSFIIPTPIDALGQPAAITVIDHLEPAAEEAALEEGRKNKRPVFARVSKLAEVQRLLAGGVAGFIGMISDTDHIDRALLVKMRDLRLIWVPVLAQQPAALLDIAKRNTLQLSSLGVPIAVGGSPVEREMEVLADAGMSPGDIIVAATRTAAEVRRKSLDIGTLQPGRLANLWMLAKNPIEDIRNLKSSHREILEGN